MPNQIVFPCPSCGASLSAQPSEVSIQCQFCGSTAMVPAAMRAQAPQPAQAYAPLPVTSDLDPAQTKAIGDAIRAGDKPRAAQLYRASFGGDLAAAQQAVETLALGQPVMVGTTSTGGPAYIQVAPVAPAAPYLMPMPAMPVMPAVAIPDNRRIMRGVMGFNLAIMIFVLLLTACIGLAVLLPFAFMAFPGLLGGHPFGF